MSCTLATLAACFSISNFYVDGGLAWQDRKTAEIGGTDLVFTTPEGPRVFHQYITTAASNPYGRLALGYAIDMRTLTIALEGTHTSSLATDKDRGINALEIRARWYPFRH